MHLRTFTAGFILDGESYIATCYSTAVKTKCYIICENLGFAIFNTSTFKPEYISSQLNDKALAKMTTCIKLAFAYPIFFSDSVKNTNILN